MKIGVVSLGCPKNLVDSEVMMGLAQQAGHQLTTDPADADVLVVNTCAFIDAAKQESVDAILEMAERKRTGRCTRLIVTGCLAERYRTELRAEIPEIDAVLGTGDVPAIVDAIERRHERAHWVPVTLYRRHGGEGASTGSARPERAEGRGWGPAIAVALRQAPGDATGEPVLPTYLYDAETPRTLATPNHVAYVKIAEGCDYQCAFCIIPRLRGRYRSRPAESILREARALVARGVRELILISQDTTFYGIDQHERGALPRLLRELNTLDGLEWIRLLYLYPTTISDDTLAAVAECDKVCKYIDLPLQHAADAVLRRMKRPGTRRGYERLLRRIRDRVPGVTLRTTFIVGFPGETQPDFAELCAFVREMAFDHVGVFTYSHEEGTTAYGLEDDVPAATKRRRRERLMALQKRLVSRAQKRRIGQTVRVMVDGPAADQGLVLQGRLEGQAPEIDPVVYLTETDGSQYQPGDMVPAILVGARGYDLIARPTYLGIGD